MSNHDFYHRVNHPSLKSAIYDILVEECGASEDWREMFMVQWPDCREFRFVGALGFGGKVWFSDPVRVNCYQEDMTPDRVATITSANKRLKAL